ncbi:hypothetical protein PUN4_150145 [Paraburkholderia unamae]|nr:hypothetical protein PUN4_150145 [Paraburkholderia unamae]
MGLHGCASAVWYMARAIGASANFGHGRYQLDLRPRASRFRARVPSAAPFGLCALTRAVLPGMRAPQGLRDQYYVGGGVRGLCGVGLLRGLEQRRRGREEGGIRPPADPLAGLDPLRTI